MNTVKVAPVRQISLVCIPTREQDRAVAFYESLGFEKRTDIAFGNGYRFGKKEAAKLRSGNFYSPLRHVKEIDGSKLLMFHAKDDESVRWNEVAKFAKATDATLKLLKKGGHLNSGKIVRKYWQQIGKFLKE